MKNALISFLIVASGITLLTCKDAAEQIMPKPPVPGPGSGPILEITDEQRLAVLKECKDFVNALGDLKSDAAQQVLVTWLKTRREFAEADTLGGNVWAYFHDGRLAMILPDWRTVGENDGGRIGQPDNSGRKKTSPAAGRTSGQPGSNQVKLFLGLGKRFADYRPLIKSIFSKKAYRATLEDASIENLTNTSDLGVFYISTHGGLGLTKPREDKKTLFGLWTTDTTSLANERIYVPELNNYFLVYMLAKHNTDVKEWHYGITEHFVDAYMNFAENAVVYNDACNGMGPNASAFRESMIKKAEGGKATFIGWTRLSDDVAGEAAAGFIFDRMLGTNMDINAQGATIGSEEPKQRPFDFAKIFDDLGNFMVGNYPLGVSQHGGRLAYQSVNTSEIILTPSIEYIGMSDYTNQMFIHGFFGENTGGDGKVTVDGVSVPTNWSTKLLICELPSAGQGSAGNVVVSVRGNESNVVPLSEWTIPLNLSKDYGITLEANLKLKIRADVHSYRSKPGEAPKTERPDSLGILSDQNNLGWLFSAGSSGTYVVGGQRQASCTSDKCLSQETESAVSRNGTLPYAKSGGHGYSAFYKWSTNMKKLYVHAIVDVPDVGVEIKYHTACEGRAPIDGGQSLVRKFGIDTTISPGLPVLEFNLDENHNVQAGRIVVSEDATWSVCMRHDKMFTTAIWPTVEPKFAPKRDTEARIASDD